MTLSNNKKAVLKEVKVSKPVLLGEDYIPIPVVLYCCFDA